MTRTNLSIWGRAGLALLAIHAALLFFPPIPPITKGSLWSYLIGYGGALLLLIELAKRRDEVVVWWSGSAPQRRRLIGLAAVIGTFATSLILALWAPGIFKRFSGEEGLWEPLTLLSYFGSALIIGLGGRSSSGSARKHLQFIAALYFVMGLEEIDYFGMFGGLIGRISGIYAGSLHDLLLLAGAGVLSLMTWAVIAAGTILAGAALWRAGYLQPRALLSLIGSLQFLWVVAGFSFLFAAAAGEAGVFGSTVVVPNMEEVLELCGALSFLVYALQLSDLTTFSTRPSASKSSSLGTPKPMRR